MTKFVELDNVVELHQSVIRFIPSSYGCMTPTYKDAARNVMS
ncbi:MAG: hypothetical protein WA364_13665 [Candidatus Nitrosopolaris sp.]